MVGNRDVFRKQADFGSFLDPEEVNMVAETVFVAFSE